MTEELKSFETISIQLFNFLKEKPEKEERSSYIEKLNLLLDERLILAQRLKNIEINPFVDSDMAEELKHVDQFIHKALGEIKEEIKEDLIQIKSVKKNEIKYIDPYNQMNTNNSVYFDNRK
ncbi:hypothetical protein WMO40_12395 [Bacillaceae bacterium CLA-AA-H227]|uniref:Uncharacterized protein n=1 Tax=Robertmurraya yapensis (ex Hitch et al 2024) TaxID=3133160 RepID=A0ACC6SBV1_9BACI